MDTASIIEFHHRCNELEQLIAELQSKTDNRIEDIRAEISKHREMILACIAALRETL